MPTNQYKLRDLREIDIENLSIGRITNWALLKAINRVKNNNGFGMNGLETINITTSSHTILADELNDMLEAARAVDPLRLKEPPGPPNPPRKGRFKEGG